MSGVADGPFPELRSNLRSEVVIEVATSCSCLGEDVLEMLLVVGVDHRQEALIDEAILAVALLRG